MGDPRFCDPSAPGHGFMQPRAHISAQLSILHIWINIPDVDTRSSTGLISESVSSKVVALVMVDSSSAGKVVSLLPFTHKFTHDRSKSRHATCILMANSCFSAAELISLDDILIRWSRLVSYCK